MTESTETNKIAQSADNLVGQVFEGRFQIVSVLGRGGMGMVYKAKHLHMGKDVAIKMLVSTINDDRSFLRFEQEARAASSLTHPNIITIYDFGRSNQGQAYLVMEYLQGRTLEDLVIADDMTLERFDKVFRQVCAGMQHAHKKGIIHRDLKPSNIMIYDTEEATDQVKIVDFGLAKLNSGNGTQQLTHEGMVVGSPAFMSPEQCRGEELDNRSDIYSLGCVMYTSLAKQVPLLGDNSMATIYKHISDIPLPVSQVVPDTWIPLPLEDLVMQTLQKSKEARPQSMAELSKSLEDAMRNANQKNHTVPSQSIKLASGAKSMQLDEVRKESDATKVDLRADIPITNSKAATTSLQNKATQNQDKKVMIASVSVCLIAALAVFSLSSAQNKTEKSTNKTKQTNTKLPSSYQTSNANKQDASPQQVRPDNNRTNPAITADNTNKVVPASSALSKQDTSTSKQDISTPKYTGPSAVSIASLQKERAKADQAKRNEAALLSAELNQRGLNEFKMGNNAAARDFFERALVQEKIAYGENDVRQLSLLSRLIACLRNDYNYVEMKPHLDSFLEIFHKHQKDAERYINSTGSSSGIWRPLAFSSMEMAKHTADINTSKTYMRWSANFFRYTLDSWDRPKDNDYFQTIISAAFVEEQIGDHESAKQLRAMIPPGQLIDGIRPAGGRIRDGFRKFHRQNFPGGFNGNQNPGFNNQPGGR